MPDYDPDPDLTAQQIAHREYLARTSMEVWKPETPPRGPEGFEVFAAIGLLAIGLIGLALMVWVRSI
ncbi:MAG TPA: hypothetical protein PK677_11145 [Acidiphilium sp.]|nr:hypothetical protein [Acidiphilium sp.]